MPLIRGRLLWGYVIVPLHNPWFHVQYALTDESGDRFSKTVFLSTVDQLLDISQHDNVQLEHVDLVSPDTSTVLIDGKWSRYSKYFVVRLRKHKTGLDMFLFWKMVRNITTQTIRQKMPTASTN